MASDFTQKSTAWTEPSFTAHLRATKEGQCFVTHYFDHACQALANSAGIRISTRTILAVDDGGRGEEKAYRLTIVTRLADQPEN